MGTDIVSNLLLRIQTTGEASLASAGVSAKAAGDSAGSMGASFLGAAAKISAGVGIAAAAVGIFSLKVGSDFNNAVLAVANNTGMSNKAMESMRQEILKLGADSPAPLADITTGFEKAADAGLKGKAAFTVVKESMMAAVETGAKLSDTVQAVTGVLKDFNIPAKDAGKVLGILMKAAADGDIRMTDMVTNFNKVAVEAGAMKIPVSEAAAAFSTLTRFTHNAALSQTLLSGMFMHILQPTAAAKAQIEQLSQSSGVDLVSAFQKVKDGGMDLTTFMGQMRDALGLTSTQMGSLVPIMKNYSDGTSSASQTQDALRSKLGASTSALFSMFGGLRGGLGALVLMSSGWKDYNKTAGDTAHAGNLVDSQWKRTLDNMSNLLKIVENNIKIAGIAISGYLIPPIQDALKFLVAHRADFSDFFTALKGFIKEAFSQTGVINDFKSVLTDLKGVFSDFWSILQTVGGDLSTIFGLFAGSGKSSTDGMKSSVSAFAGALKSAADVLKLVSDGLKFLSPLIVPIVAGMIAWQAAVWLVQGATAAWAIIQAILDAELVANPIGLIILAIAALVAIIVLVITHWKEIQKVIGDVWNTITGFISGALDALKAAWNDSISAVEAFGSKILSVLKGAWDSALSAVEKFGSDVLSAISKAIQDVIGWLKANWQELLLAAITGPFGALFLLLQTIFGKQIDAFATAAKSMAKGFLDKLSSLPGDVGKGLAAIGTAISTFIGDMAAWGLHAASSFITGIKNGILGLAGSLGGTVMSAIGGIFHGLSPPPLLPAFDMEAWGKTHGESFVKGIAEGLGDTGALKTAMGTIGALLQAPSMANSTGGGASQSTGLTTALTQLDSGLSKFPASFSAAGATILANEKTARATLDATYLNGVKAANTAHIDGINKAYQAAETSRKAAEASSQSSMKSAMSSYATSVKSARASELAAEKAALEGHVSGLKAANTTLLDQIKSANTAFTATLSADENKTTVDRKALAAATTASQKALDTARIAADKSNISALEKDHSSALSQLQTISTQHVQGMSSSLQSHITQLRAQLAAHITSLQSQLQAHIKSIASSLATHLAGIQTTLKNHIGSLNAALNTHLAGLKQALDAGDTKLAATIKAMNAPGGLWTVLQTQVNKVATSTMTALDQALLTGKGNLDKLTAAAAKAQANVNAMASAQAAAVQKVDLALGDFTGAVGATTTKLQGDLQNALDKYSYDLVNHTGDIAADSLAIKAANSALGQYTDAQTAATAQETAASSQTTTALNSLSGGLTAVNAALAGTTASLNAVSGSSNGLYAADLAQAQALAADTLATYENAAAAGVSGAALNALQQDAINAGVAVAQLQAIASSISTGVTTAMSTTIALPANPTVPAQTQSPFAAAATGSPGTAGNPLVVTNPTANTTAQDQLAAQVAANAILAASNALLTQQLKESQYQGQTLASIESLSMEGDLIDVSSDQGFDPMLKGIQAVRGGA